MAAGGSSRLSHVDPEVEEMSEEQDIKWEPGFRRKLRQQFRALVTDTQRRRDEINLEEIVKKLKQLNNLDRDVVASREAVIDSELLRLLTEITRELVDSTHGELISFHTEEYAEKLVTFMGGRRGGLESRGAGRLDWPCLGERALKAFKRTPTLSFLHGALEVQPLKKREKHGPTQRREPVQVKQLKEVCDLQEEEESTTKDVGHIFQHLREACEGRGVVHYFRFLVDPESFAHTVENMFHFSFLIKEGRAGMDVGEDGQPYIHLPEEVDEVGISTRMTKNQVIVSLNMEEWKRAIEKFDISEAYIPRRSS